jgi:hypothetical protein
MITVFGVTPEPRLIADYAEAGATRTVFWLPTSGEAELVPQLDEIARAIGDPLR